MLFYTRLVSYQQTYIQMQSLSQWVAERGSVKASTSERMGSDEPTEPATQPRYVKVIFEDLSEDAGSTPPPDPIPGDIWRTRLGEREWSGVNWMSL